MGIERDEENYDDYRQQHDEENEQYELDCAERAQDMNQEVRSIW